MIFEMIFSLSIFDNIWQDEVGGGVLYVGGWDAAEDIAGLQAAGVSQIQIIIFDKKVSQNDTYDYIGL